MPLVEQIYSPQKVQGLLSNNMWKRLKKGETVKSKDGNYFVAPHGLHFLQIQTREYRLQVLKSCVGLKDKEIRNILELPDGSIYRHEYDAIVLKFPEKNDTNVYIDGVYAYMEGIPQDKNIYLKNVQAPRYKSWNSGWCCAELACLIHGKDKVTKVLYNIPSNATVL